MIGLKLLAEIMSFVVAAIFYGVGLVFFFAGLGCHAIAWAFGMVFSAIYAAWHPK